MTSFRLAVALAATIVTTGLAAASCAGSDDVKGHTGGTGAGSGTGTGAGSGTGASTGSGGGIPAALCLLHNCSSDNECAGCSDGRTGCLIEEHRCVACGPGGSSCPDGQVCSSFGNCVPPTLTCPTDNGVPTITCDKSADCAACDPAHQVCDTAAHKCVACTGSDTTQCQSTDTCSGGDCAPKCPSSCTSDSDCSDCGGPGHAAHACNAHKCTECSGTVACGSGQTCGVHGTCDKTCGISGQVKGTCQSDADCAGCTGSLTKCHTPIGGGAGTCGAAATGCSDLGKGTVVLPSPFDQVTNTCSNDTDCANVGIELNVGKLLRDLTGLDVIHDANLDYGMHVCASVSLADKSCGICVPCRVDSDCQPIDVDQIASQAFGPLGGIAASYLLDQIFGPSDHQVHMYCEAVAAGYGVCAPCPGLLNDCSVGTTPVGGTGTCEHDACAAGGPLDPACDPCAASLCAFDSYCCSSQWDASCVGEVDRYCTKTCGTTNTCAHSECNTGSKLDSGCSDCAFAVCQVSPECCSSTWDQACIDQVPLYCDSPKCAGQCSDPAQCWPNGCLATYTCGPCYADYDCYPKLCNQQTKQCQ